MFIILFCFYRSMLNQAAHAAQNYGAPSSPQSGMAPQSGRGASVVSLNMWTPFILLNEKKCKNVTNTQLNNEQYFRFNLVLRFSNKI